MIIGWIGSGIGITDLTVMEEYGTHGISILTMEIGILITGGAIKITIHIITTFMDQELNG